MKNPSPIDVFLASKSPRRRELLTQIGVRFQVIDIDVEEQKTTNEDPAHYVSRLAKSKALAGFELNGKQPTLGADTIVVSGRHVLEKPTNYPHFLSMLTLLSGKSHQVYTAVALKTQHIDKLVLTKTVVTFGQIDESQAQAYWRTGEPCDKAGGYGIQGFAAVFVEKIEGSYSAVVGLPLKETADLLSEAQIPFWHI